MARHRTLTAFGVAATMALAIVACSDDDGGGGDAASDPASCNNSLELDGAAADGGRPDGQFGAQAVLAEVGGEGDGTLRLAISGFDLDAPLPVEPPADAPPGANLLLVTLEAPEGGFADGQTFTQEGGEGTGRITDISLSRGTQALTLDVTTITLGRVDEERVCGSVTTDGSGVEGTFNAGRVGGAPADPADGSGEPDGEAAPAPGDECRNSLRVRGDGDTSEPFGARAVVAEGGTADDPAVRVAISGADLPGGTVPTGDPGAPEGTNVLVFSLVPAGEGVAPGQAFATDPGEGEGELADLALWAGPDELEVGAVTVTVSAIDDDQVCGTIESDGPGVVGSFRALRSAGEGGEVGDGGAPPTTGDATTTSAA